MIPTNSLMLHGFASSVFSKLVPDFEGLYDYQTQLLDDWDNIKQNATIHCRQAGITTLIIAHAVYKAMLHPNSCSGILGHNEGLCSHIIDMINEIIPRDYIKSQSTESIRLVNGSSIFCFNATENVISGRTATNLYVDNYDFITNRDSVHKAIMPIVTSAKGNMVITSTPTNSKGIYSLDPIKFRKKVITWDMIPGRDLAWKDRTVKTLSNELFQREYGCIVV